MEKYPLVDRTRERERESMREVLCTFESVCFGEQMIGREKVSVSDFEARRIRERECLFAATW